MLAIVFYAALCLVGQSLASEFRPEVKSCIENGVFYLRDLVAGNVVYGENATGAFSFVFTKALENSPKVIVNATVGGAPFPCPDDPECKYDLCDSNTDTGKWLSAPWNSTCPVPAGTYSYTETVYLDPALKELVNGNPINKRVEIEDGGQIVGCQEYSFTISEEN
ncbi:uncharacterized protein ISCGN_019660 [Ixodes scapularis]